MNSILNQPLMRLYFSYDAAYIDSRQQHSSLGLKHADQQAKKQLPRSNTIYKRHRLTFALDRLEHLETKIVILDTSRMAEKSI